MECSACFLLQHEIYDGIFDERIDALLHRCKLFLTVGIHTLYEACSSGLLSALFPFICVHNTGQACLVFKNSIPAATLDLSPAKRPQDEKSAPWILKVISLEPYCRAINLQSPSSNSCPKCWVQIITKHATAVASVEKEAS